MQSSSTKSVFPWWQRYLYGLGMVAFPIFAYSSNSSGPAWVLWLIGIVGICMMYEILAAVVVGGLVWAFFGAIAGIPTSAAIIIGALIIADSNKK